MQSKRTKAAVFAVVLVFEREGGSFLADAQPALLWRSGFARERDGREKKPADCERCGELVPVSGARLSSL